MTAHHANIPNCDIDFWSDEVILNPWPHYAGMRELGPVIWMAQHGNYALTRHAEVRAGLQDHRCFSSAQGVAGDAFGCSFLQGNTVASNPPRHRQLRHAMAPPLLPSAMASIRDGVQTQADELIAGLVQRDEFDAIADLARYLPLAVVRDLVGLPDFGQDRMLAWAGAAFDVLGVQNERGCQALETIAEMREFIARDVTPETLKPGSWTQRVLGLVDEGKLDPELAPFALRDYINPSLDTTIAATGQLIWQLGRNPDLWQLLRDDPALLHGAVHEAVRLGSPIRSFSRHAVQDVEVAGITIPAGSRVMMVYASANRDERVFPEPDLFQPARDPKLHLGFGTGIHMCVGMNVAVLKMECLLRAILDQPSAVELGEPAIVLNNTIQTFAKLPASFTAR